MGVSTREGLGIGILGTYCLRFESAGYDGAVECWDGSTGVYDTEYLSDDGFVNRFVDISHPFEVQAPLADSMLASRSIAGFSGLTQKRALCAEIGDYRLCGGLWYRFGDGKAYHDENAEESGRKSYHGDEVKLSTTEYGRKGSLNYFG